LPFVGLEFHKKIKMAAKIMANILYISYNSAIYKSIWLKFKLYIYNKLPKILIQKNAQDGGQNIAQTFGYN